LWSGINMKKEMNNLFALSGAGQSGCKTLFDFYFKEYNVSK
jgi:hypothetical protein